MNLDDRQKAVKLRLDHFRDELLLFTKEESKAWFLLSKFRLFVDFLKKNDEFLSKPAKKKPQIGLYIYGGVGRGKTMLMKDFFSKAEIALNSEENLTNVPKNKYFHFNSFMILLHQKLHEIRQNKDESAFKKKLEGFDSDELRLAVSLIIGDSRLICFDEFQVVDVADAALLSRIFSYFFEKKIWLVMTSNSHPLQLYKNGLQREIFLKFVHEILLKHCEILHLDSEIDYRFEISKIRKLFFVNDDKHLSRYYSLKSSLIPDFKPEEKAIEVYGRKINLQETYGEISVIKALWLIESNFFVADFKEICRNFKLIFLENLPQFGFLQINESRRFTAFIDEVYEQKVQLIILAEVELSQLCLEIDKLPFFERTISRIAEITGT